MNDKKHRKSMHEKKENIPTIKQIYDEEMQKITNLNQRIWNLANQEKIEKKNLLYKKISLCLFCLLFTFNLFAILLFLGAQSLALDYYILRTRNYLFGIILLSIDGIISFIIIIRGIYSLNKTGNLHE